MMTNFQASFLIFRCINLTSPF